MGVVEWPEPSTIWPGNRWKEEEWLPESDSSVLAGFRVEATRRPARRHRQDRTEDRSQLFNEMIAAGDALVKALNRDNDAQQESEFDANAAAFRRLRREWIVVRCREYARAMRRWRESFETGGASE